MRIRHGLFFAFLLLSSKSLPAQVRYGTIEYIKTTEREIELEGMEENRELKKMMAKMAASGAFTEKYKATFTPDGFTFIRQERPVSSITSEMGGGNSITIETGGEDPTHHYTNTTNGVVTNTDFILDRTFLIEGTEKPLVWTETGETVAPDDGTMGLELRLATAVTPAGVTITAGYAPSLPIQVGPLNYYGLPGAIITLRIPQEKKTLLYRAIGMAVSNEPLPLVIPTEGKKIKLESFRKERA